MGFDINHFQIKYSTSTFASHFNALLRFLGLRQTGAGPQYSTAGRDLATKWIETIPRTKLVGGSPVDRTQDNLIADIRLAIMIHGMSNAVLKQTLMATKDLTLPALEEALLNDLGVCRGGIMAAVAELDMDSGEQGNATFNGTCRWCRKPGHYEQDCNDYNVEYCTIG